MTFESIKEKVNKLRFEKDSLAREIESQSLTLNTLKDDLETIVQSQVFLQKVAKSTQDQLSVEIDTIVNLGLQAIFPNQYKFHLSYEINRGKTEARFNLFDMKDNPVDPMNSLGGGAVDVIALSLRIALFALTSNDNVIVLDEPCRFVSVNLRERMSELIKIFSDKINCQIIMVTHIEEFEQNANVIRIKKENGASKVVA